MFSKISELDCFDHSISYSGVATLLLTNVSSPWNCQAECFSNAECSVFVYETTRRECSLKSSKMDSTMNEVIISGPKSCTFYQGWLI